MRLDTAFRLSFYVTLGLACACLVQADAYFLPWLVFLVPVLVGAFALAWRKEGLWEISETAANYLGLVIALAGAGWILFQLPRTDEDLLTGLAWPAGLLPHLGPLILVLLVVKLFRPKRLADFWVLQTIGLMTVTLGCVLAGEAVFGGLLVAYLASLLWCLALFHFRHEQRFARQPVAAHAPLFAPGDALLPWRYQGAARVSGWLAVVLPLGFGLFLLTPRHGDGKWVPQRLSTSSNRVLKAGVDPGMDLNRTGQIELPPDPVFQVAVTDAAGRPRQMTADPYWRVEVLDYYLKGHWITWAQAQEYFRQVGPRTRPLRPDEEPPGNAADRLHVRFRFVPAQVGGLVLAEPIDVGQVGLDPRAGDHRPLIDLFHEMPGCDALVPYIPARKQTYSYSQIIVPNARPGWTPALRASDEYRAYLLDQAPPEPIAAWTRRQLATMKGLPPAMRQLDEQGRVAPEHHARLAQSLCDRLARSREFGYSLFLRRQDRDLDPTADFLLNVKHGHCERYASALALMLRSVGIPSRVVKGYRGAEALRSNNPRGEADAIIPGAYQVRQNMAHSWVQALVQQDGEWHWLTLEPTPADGADDQLRTWANWVSSLDGRQIWRKFVLEYDTDMQRRSVKTLWERLRSGEGFVALLWTALGLATAAALLWGLWRFRARLARFWPHRADDPQARAAVGFYDRLLHLLARRLGLRPARGQTPLEFGQTAAAVLQGQTGTAAVATVPVAVAEALYRVRFGGRELTADEQEALQQRLAALQDALTRRPFPISV